MRIIPGLILPVVFSTVSFFSSVSVFAQDENLNKPRPKVMVVIYSTEVSSSFLGVAIEGNRNTENQMKNPYLQIIGLQSGSLDIRFTEK